MVQHANLLLSLRLILLGLDKPQDQRILLAALPAMSRVAVIRHIILSITVLTKPFIFLHSLLFFLFLWLCRLRLSLVILTLSVRRLWFILVSFARRRLLLPTVACNVSIILLWCKLLETFCDVIDIPQIKVTGNLRVHTLLRSAENVVIVTLRTAPHGDCLFLGLSVLRPLRLWLILASLVDILGSVRVL